MKNYTSPIIEYMEIETDDVITASSSFNVDVKEVGSDESGDFIYDAYHSISDYLNSVLKK